MWRQRQSGGAERIKPQWDGGVGKLDANLIHRFGMFDVAAIHAQWEPPIGCDLGGNLRRLRRKCRDVTGKRAVRVLREPECDGLFRVQIDEIRLFNIQTGGTIGRDDACELCARRAPTICTARSEERG